MIKKTNLEKNTFSVTICEDKIDKSTTEYTTISSGKLTKGMRESLINSICKEFGIRINFF